MAQVIWEGEALTALDRIAFYIEQFDPEAASRLAARLIEAGESLASFPIAAGYGRTKSASW